MRSSRFARRFTACAVSSALAALLLPAAAPAAVLQGNASVPWGTDSVSVQVKIDQTAGTIQFQMRGPDSQWFGWAFGGSLPTHQGYAILNFGPSALAREYTMAGFQTPTFQFTQNCSGPTVLQQGGGMMTAGFDRAWNDGDVFDYQFPVSDGSTIDVAWAVGPSLSFAMHTSRGSGNMTFHAPGATGVASPTAKREGWGQAKMTFRQVAP